MPRSQGVGILEASPYSYSATAVEVLGQSRFEIASFLPLAVSRGVGLSTGGVGVGVGASAERAGGSPEEDSDSAGVFIHAGVVRGKAEHNLKFKNC